MNHELKGVLVEVHVIYAARNVYGSGIYWDVLMSRGAEVSVMQGFRGGSDAVDHFSYRLVLACVDAVCRSDGNEGDRCLKSFDVGLGLCGPNAGGEDGCMQSDRSSCVMGPLFLLNQWRGES